MTSPAEPVRMALPEEIEARIAALLAFERDVVTLYGSAVAKRSRDHARAALTTAILSRLSAAEAGREEDKAHIARLEKALRFTDATVTAFMGWLDEEGTGLDVPMPLALAMIDAQQQREAALSSPAPAEEG